MPSLMDQNSIMEVIPQRIPFLLVDEVKGLMPGKDIRAIRNVEFNDPSSLGNGGIIPAGISLEMMYQAICICVLSMPENKDKILILEEVKKFQVRDDIEPGVIIDIEASISRIRRDIVIAKASATVDGDKKQSAEFVLKLQDISIDLKDEKQDPIEEVVEEVIEETEETANSTVEESAIEEKEAL